jgi:predicted nucleic acid-binding protein
VLPYLDQRRSELWVTSSLVVCEFFRPATRRQSVPQAQAWLGQVLDDVAPFEESAGLEAACVEASLSQ